MRSAARPDGRRLNANRTSADTWNEVGLGLASAPSSGERGRSREVRTVVNLWEAIQSHPQLFGAMGGAAGLGLLIWAVIRTSYRYR